MAFNDYIPRFGWTVPAAVAAAIIAVAGSGCSSAPKIQGGRADLRGARFTNRIVATPQGVQIVDPNVATDTFEKLVDTYARSVSSPDIADQLMGGGSLDAIDGKVGETSPTPQDIQANTANYIAGVLPPNLSLEGQQVDLRDIITWNSNDRDHGWVMAHKDDDRMSYGNLVLFHRGGYAVLGRGKGLQKAMMDNAFSNYLNALIGDNKVTTQVTIHGRDKNTTAFRYHLDEFNTAGGRIVPLLHFDGDGMMIRNLYLTAKEMEDLKENNPKQADRLDDPFYFVAVKRKGNNGFEKIETGFYQVAQRVTAEYIDGYRLGREFEINTRSGIVDKDGNLVPFPAPTIDDMLENPDLGTTRIVQFVSNEYGRPVGMATIEYYGSVNPCVASGDSIAIDQNWKRCLAWANIGIDALKSAAIWQNGHLHHHKGGDSDYTPAVTGGRTGQQGGADITVP